MRRPDEDALGVHARRADVAGAAHRHRRIGVDEDGSAAGADRRQAARAGNIYGAVIHIVVAIKDFYGGRLPAPRGDVPDARDLDVFGRAGVDATGTIPIRGQVPMVVDLGIATSPHRNRPAVHTRCRDVACPVASC